LPTPSGVNTGLAFGDASGFDGHPGESIRRTGRMSEWRSEEQSDGDQYRARGRHGVTFDVVCTRTERGSSVYLSGQGSVKVVLETLMTYQTAGRQLVAAQRATPHRSSRYPGRRRYGKFRWERSGRRGHRRRSRCRDQAVLASALREAARSAAFPGKRSRPPPHSARPGNAGPHPIRERRPAREQCARAAEVARLWCAILMTRGVRLRPRRPERSHRNFP